MLLFTALLFVAAADVRSAEAQPLGDLLVAPASMPSSEPVQGFVDEGAASQPSSQAAAVDAEKDDEPALPQRVVERPWYQSLGLAGFLDAGFAAVWPDQTNTFFVGEVELDVKKTLLDVAGLRIDLNLLNRLAWQPLGVSSVPSFINFGLVFDNIVEQAYAEWFPLGESGPRLRLGKFNAVVGFERQDAADRFMISQSLVFLHGSPANFTGLMLHVPLPVSLSFTLHAAINGWDRGIAPSRNKTIGAMFTFDHRVRSGTRFLLQLTGIFGTERFANEKDYRITLFGTAAIDMPNRFLFATEVTWGTEPGVVPGSFSDVLAATGTPVLARWFGVSAWIRGVIPRVEWLSLTARYDFFNDPQRARGLVQTISDVNEGALSQRQQVSANVAATITEGALVRIEYTGDFIQGREPDRVRALAVAHRLALQAVYRF